MTSSPSDIEGIEEIHVVLTQTNGSSGSWQKYCRPFIDELRNQFLIWRSLPIETIMHDRKMTSELLKKDKLS